MYRLFDAMQEDVGSTPVFSTSRNGKRHPVHRPFPFVWKRVFYFIFVGTLVETGGIR